LVSHARGDGLARTRAVRAFADASTPQPSRRPEKADLVLGTVGTLLAAAILHETLTATPDDLARTDLDTIRKLGDSTLDRLWTDLDAASDIATDPRRYLGIAHGWAGFLLASLRWCATTGTPPPANLETRADELAALGRPSGSRLQWPWTNDGAPTVPGWCNGSAGFVHLWIACHETFRADRWAVLAERAALDATAASGVPQLCCGLAGQAYALLALHRHTGQARWRAHAEDLAERAATRILAGGASGCIGGSLHKGELGVAVLAADLENPHRSTMPFFGPPA
jgi:serine/threonine-protein kinase